MNTTTINGFVVPKPMSEAQSFYWVMAKNIQGNGESHGTRFKWRDDKFDRYILENGVGYATEAEVQAVIKAKRGIDPEWGE